MAKKNVEDIVINKVWCKGCGICVHFCPKKVLEMDKDSKASVVKLEDCIGCRLCELRCPDFAIQVNFKDKDE